MNDLELMLMLEEYGYEPSIENVKFLKEDLGLSDEVYLDEGVRDAVEYSDYELYQILDESGYKPTEKNLYLLKEGLESGKYEILTEGPLTNAVRNIKGNIAKTRVAKKNYEARVDSTNSLQNLDLLKPGEYAERMARAKKQKEDLLATRVPLKKIFTNPDKNKKN